MLAKSCVLLARFPAAVLTVWPNKLKLGRSLGGSIFVSGVGGRLLPSCLARDRLSLVGAQDEWILQLPGKYYPEYLFIVEIFSLSYTYLAYLLCYYAKIYILPFVYTLHIYYAIMLK